MRNNPIELQPVPTNFAAMAKYYVVAVQYGASEIVPLDKVQKCLYFKYDATQERFIPVDPRTELVARSGVGFVGYVCLEQLKDPPADVVDPSQLEADVTLFGATVKTLSRAGTDTLPGVFESSSTQIGRNPSVMIPVSPQTSRGVILIFTVDGDNGATQLRATFDPEIKGSTNG
jgi:hypothetical protein